VGTIDLAPPPGLRHCTDDGPGLRRHGRKRFRYVDDRSGDDVTDEPTLARIAALAIPPAWTDVWICPDARGHVQATGRDAKGRKQYRYHADYRAQRETAKFADLVPFGEALGDLRKAIDADLRLPDLGQERVLGLVLALLDRTAIRIGNESYARANKTFGLTTLRDKHVTIEGSTVAFCFVGKAAKRHEVKLTDRRLASLVRRCRDVPGQQLFQWEDADGGRHGISSDDVNGRLRALTGLDVTAKTFRTWHASVGAAALLAGQPLPESQRGVNSAVVEVCDEIANTLGNTRTVARASYVHPAVPAAFEAGLLHDWWREGPTRSAGGLEPDERKLLAVLRKAKRRGLGAAPTKVTKGTRKAA
jgi:DNA topoisomerase-1